MNLFNLEIFKQICQKRTRKSGKGGEEGTVMQSNEISSLLPKSFVLRLAVRAFSLHFPS